MLDQIFGYHNKDGVIELYNNAEFSGEPFAKSNYYTYSYSNQISFMLIKSTDVYIKFTDVNK